MKDYTAINLPSKCMLYEGIEENSIQVRTFIGEDEEKIVQLGFSNIKKKLLEIFRSVVKGIDPEQLTSGDAEYILLWEAINSYTNLFPISMICESCTADIELSVDLNTINSENLPDGFVQPVEIDLPLCKQKVRLRVPTLMDDVLSAEFASSGKSNYLYGIAQCIVDELDVLSRIKFLKDLDTKEDLAKIRGFFVKYKHGPDMMAKYTCPQCDWEGRVFVPFRFEELLAESARS